jgi:hypothetical protein
MNKTGRCGGVVMATIRVTSVKVDVDGAKRMIVHERCPSFVALAKT